MSPVSEPNPEESRLEEPRLEEARAEAPQLETPTAVPAPSWPFWTWSDAAVFVGMAIPCLALVEGMLYVLTRVTGSRTPDAAVQIGAQGVLYLLIFAALAAILRFNYGAPFWRSLGWTPSRVPVAGAIAIGVVLALVVALVGGLLQVKTPHSDVQKLLTSPHGLIAVTAFAVTVAPLAEELIFRGFLQPLAVRSLGAVAGIIVTGSLFGLLHLQEYGRSWGAAAMVALAGIGFGVLRHVSGSIKPCVFAHAGYNGVLFVAYFSSMSANTGR